ncbi:hypothetical protein ACW9H6_12180 [Pseudomonas sp. SDO528_S397]
MFGWLPSPPTDNLYKLMAIFGMWLSAGLIAALLALSYLKYNIDQSTDEFIYKQHVKNDIEKIKKRLASLKADKPEQNVLEWSSGFKDEKAVLEKVLESNLETINSDTASKKEELLQPDNPIIKFIFKSNLLVYTVIVIYIPLAIFCLCFGFRRWAVRVQGPSERLNELDIELKKAALVKLQIEISQMQPMSETVKKLFELRGILLPKEK